jgi:hypothetical protein
MDRHRLLLLITIAIFLSIVFVNSFLEQKNSSEMEITKILRSFEKRTTELEQNQRLIDELKAEKSQLKEENQKSQSDIDELNSKIKELNATIEHLQEFQQDAAEKIKDYQEENSKLAHFEYKFKESVDEVVAFASSGSQKIWSEFQCLGPDHEDPLVWEESIPKEKRCGCFLSPNFTTLKDCPKRPAPKGKDEPLWIVLIGDSTMRQFGIGFRELLRNHDPRCYVIQDSNVNRNITSRDTEAIIPIETRAKSGFWGYWLDYEIHCPGLIISYRGLSGVSASLALSIIRHPHLHHVPPVYERFESVPMLDEPNFLEIPWSLPIHPPKNGPDVFLLAAGVWEATRSDFEPTDECAYACLEYQRCKMKLKKPTTRNLFRRRMHAIIDESNCLWGADRIILRNSAENEHKTHLPHFNKEMQEIAKEKNVRLLDYNSLNSEYDNAYKDMAHPPEWVVRRGLKTLVEMLPQDRIPPVMKPILEINKTESGPPPNGKFQWYLQ